MLAPVTLMRFFAVLVLLLCIVTGCGSRHSSVPSPVVARVAGYTVTRPQLDRYARYVATFDSVVYPDSAEAACLHQPKRRACRSLRAHVLQRLIEERVVLRYAARHHIQLSAHDKAVGKAQVRELLRPSSPTSRLFRMGISKRFVWRVVQRQLLVQQVEERVAGKAAVSGPQLHIRKIAIPTSGDVAADNRRIVRIATSGRVPADAAQKREWVPPFRLSSRARRALAAAQPGDYVGPFQHPDYVLLIQLLGRAQHTYGRKSRAEITSRLFHRWLAAAVARAHPTCLEPHRQPRPCNDRTMKEA